MCVQMCANWYFKHTEVVLKAVIMFLQEYIMKAIVFFFTSSEKNVQTYMGKHCGTLAQFTCSLPFLHYLFQ